MRFNQRLLRDVFSETDITVKEEIFLGCMDEGTHLNVTLLLVDRKPDIFWETMRVVGLPS